MQNPFLSILELVGLRKVVRFRQLRIHELNEQTPYAQIQKILLQSKNDVQLHVGIPSELSSETDGQTLLIQHVVGSKDQFLVCRIAPHASTSWEKKSLGETAQLIWESRTHAHCRKLEEWQLITRAAEGKTVGEY